MNTPFVVVQSCSNDDIVESVAIHIPSTTDGDAKIVTGAIPIKGVKGSLPRDENTVSQRAGSGPP